MYEVFSSVAQKMFQRMWITKRLMIAIDLHGIEKKNDYHQKNHTGLEQLEG